jgi:hypothetical protein
MSITLTTPYVISGPAGIVNPETDPNAACTRYLLDLLNGTITVYYGLGVVTAVNGKSVGWIPGAQAPSLSAVLTLSTGVWQASNGPSGTLTSDQITEARSVLTQDVAAIQNLAEALSVAIGLFPGAINDTW